MSTWVGDNVRDTHGFRFPCTTRIPWGQLDFHSQSCHVPFSGNDNGLTSSFFPHSSIRILRDSEQVGLQFSSLSTAVGLDNLRAILGDTLERVHSDQNDATVGVDTMLCIAVPNGMKD